MTKTKSTPNQNPKMFHAQEQPLPIGPLTTTQRNDTDTEERIGSVRDNTHTHTHPYTLYSITVTCSRARVGPESPRDVTTQPARSLAPRVRSPLAAHSSHPVHYLSSLPVSRSICLLVNVFFGSFVKALLVMGVTRKRRDVVHHIRWANVVCIHLRGLQFVLTRV